MTTTATATATTTATATATTTATATAARCSSCADDLDHCHGTLVVHEVGVECTEPRCVAPAAAHDWMVGCPAVGCTCGIDADEAAGGAAPVHAGLTDGAPAWGSDGDVDAWAA